MLSAIFLFLLSSTVKLQAEEDGIFFKVEEDYFLYNDNTLWNEKADSLLVCSQMCARQAACKNANFLANEGTCSLLGEGKTSLAETLLERDGSFYLEKVC